MKVLANLVAGAAFLGVTNGMAETCTSGFMYINPTTGKAMACKNPKDGQGRYYVFCNQLQTKIRGTVAGALPTVGDVKSCNNLIIDNSSNDAAYVCLTSDTPITKNSQNFLIQPSFLCDDPTSPPTNPPPTGAPTFRSNGDYTAVGVGASCEEVEGCSTINTASQCEMAASELSNDKVISEQSKGTTPSGCFLYKNKDVWFNKNMNANGKCTSDRTCLCYCGPDTEEPTTDEPTTDEPTTDEPTTDEPTTDEPTTDGPSSPYSLLDVSMYNSCAEAGCSSLTTAEQCTAAMMSTDSSWGAEQYKGNTPPGCFRYKGSKVYFNKNANSKGKCTTTRQCYCDCVNPPPTAPPSTPEPTLSGLKLVNNAATCSDAGCAQITDAQECGIAMKELTNDKTLSTQKKSNTPPGCFIWSNRNAYFNTFSASQAPCTKLRQCMCKDCTATVEPSTEEPSTEEPSTEEPSTEEPTTSEPSPYTILDVEKYDSCSESGCSTLTTSQQCDAAMKSLTNDKTLSVNSKSTTPAGCYIFRGQNVYFNKNANGKGKCTLQRQCICDCNTAPTDEPTSEEPTTEEPTTEEPTSGPSTDFVPIFVASGKNCAANDLVSLTKEECAQTILKSNNQNGVRDTKSTKAPEGCFAYMPWSKIYYNIRNVAKGGCSKDRECICKSK